MTKTIYRIAAPILGIAGLCTVLSLAWSNTALGGGSSGGTSCGTSGGATGSTSGGATGSTSGGATGSTSSSGGGQEGECRQCVDEFVGCVADGILGVNGPNKQLDVVEDCLHTLKLCTGIEH